MQTRQIVWIKPGWWYVLGFEVIICLGTVLYWLLMSSNYFKGAVFGSVYQPKPTSFGYLENELMFNFGPLDPNFLDHSDNAFERIKFGNMFEISDEHYVYTPSYRKAMERKMIDEYTFGLAYILLVQLSNVVFCCYVFFLGSMLITKVDNIEQGKERLKMFVKLQIAMLIGDVIILIATMFLWNVANGQSSAVLFAQFGMALLWGGIRTTFIFEKHEVK